MANKSGIKLLVAAAVLAAGYFGISAYLRPVATVAEAKGGKVAKAVPTLIRVRAENALEIKVEATGRMLNELKEGQIIAEDDLLVEVDPQAKQLEVDTIENTLKTTRAINGIDAKVAASRLLREKKNLEFKLAQKNAGVLPAVEYDRAVEQVEQLEWTQDLDRVRAEDNVARTELLLRGKRLELANMKFLAPFAGTLTDIKFSKGAYISGGQTVATLITNTRIVEARISEENITQGVKEGLGVRVRFTGMNGDFFGTIAKILPNQDAQTLRYIAHLDLRIDPALLNKTGQSGDGVITIDEREAKVRVPRRAIFQNQLFVVRDGVVEVRTPRTGYDSGDVVEILSGLEPGELVIVDRQDLYRNGQRVRTRPADAAK